MQSCKGPQHSNNEYKSRSRIQIHVTYTYTVYTEKCLQVGLWLQLHV